MNRAHAVLSTILVSLAVASTWASRSASAGGGTYGWHVTIVVPPGPSPNDLHVLFAGTGGTIRNLGVQPPPSSTTNNGFMIDITWPAKLPTGTTVTMDFTTEHAPIFFGGGFWTNQGNNIGAVVDADIEPQPPVTPVTSAPMLAAAAALVLGAGVLAIRRRRGA